MSEKVASEIADVSKFGMKTIYCHIHQAKSGCINNKKKIILSSFYPPTQTGLAKIVMYMDVKQDGSALSIGVNVFQFLLL